MNDVASASTAPAAPAASATPTHHPRLDHAARVMLAFGASPGEIRAEERGGIGDGYHDIHEDGSRKSVLRG